MHNLLWINTVQSIINIDWVRFVSDLSSHYAWRTKTRFEMLTYSFNWSISCTRLESGTWTTWYKNNFMRDISIQSSWQVPFCCSSTFNSFIVYVTGSFLYTVFQHISILSLSPIVMSFYYLFSNFISSAGCTKLARSKWSCPSNFNKRLWNVYRILARSRHVVHPLLYIMIFHGTLSYWWRPIHENIVCPMQLPKGNKKNHISIWCYEYGNWWLISHQSPYV